MSSTRTASSGSSALNLPNISRNRKASSGRLELRLVYRTLRLISDWALEHFYSEVYVEGIKNVEKDDALILAPCHHNEIIDIATLSATVPHRRFVSYWTKASLFKNPVSRFILSSAGSIPVARISDTSRERPLAVERDGEKNPSEAGSQEALFNATYEELARGGALGVFAEGTSYTMPRIVQVKEGAARAALGFSRRYPEKHLSLVPVGIVYTEKSKYRSRLIVCYGERIPLQPFTAQCSSAAPGSADERNAVRNLTGEIKRRLFDLTINASDWQILYASQAARDILWTGTNIPLPLFIDVSKALIDIFEEVRPTDLLAVLLRYHALQYHTGIKHGHINHIPMPRHPTKGDEQQCITAITYPRLVAQAFKFGLPLLISLPVHIAQAFAYIFGKLASSKLAGREEEAVAQYKVIIGGVGRAISAITAGSLCWKAFGVWSLLGASSHTPPMNTRDSAIGMISRAISLLPNAFQEALNGWAETCIPALRRTIYHAFHHPSFLGSLINIAGSMSFAWLILKLHSRIIDGDYERYQRLRATLLILTSKLSGNPKTIDVRDLKFYYVTPPPPINPHIARALEKDASLTGLVSQDNNNGIREDTMADNLETPKSRQIPKYILVNYLLRERVNAMLALRKFFREDVGSLYSKATDERGAKLDKAFKFIKEHNTLL